MKRLILIFLLSVLPFQMSWAVVTGYCQHEEGKAAQHLGHHNHRHKATSENKQRKDSKNSIGFNDTDCGCHHLCSAAFLSSEHRQSSVPQNSTPIEFQLQPYQSHISDCLTKPDWHRAS